MRQRALIMTLFLAIALIFPPAVRARTVHNFYCGYCHKATVSFTELGEDPLKKNVCIQCHTDGMGTTFMNSIQDDRTPKGMFTTAEASKTLATVPEDTGTSHLWARKGDVVPAAGAQAPTSYAAAFNGRYGISRGKLTCTRCHNPHGYDTDAESIKLLKVANTADAMCKDCHLPWNQSANKGLETHPTVVNYAEKVQALNDAAVQAGKPLRFKTSPTFAGSMQLVNGNVSCSTCHAPHFVDSDSSTPDGRDNRLGLGAGDGHLLRADGPLQTSKSALCTSCHNYKRHGNPLSNSKQPGRTSLPQEDVGCLVCHSGHSYNGGTPNYYVLRNVVNTITFGNKTNTLYTNITTDLFPMNKRDGTGLCERCHGISSSIPNHSIANGGTDDRYLQNCKDCHKHDEGGVEFSWKWSANAAICGDCHGFPPYLNAPGDWKDNTPGTKGGYAVMDGAGGDSSHKYASPYINYAKDETLTPHKSHAGGGELFGEATDYKFGEGQAACNPCHLDMTKHKQVDNTASFRDVSFNELSTGKTRYPALPAPLVPAYATGGNGSCTNVYCHSNGGKRTGDGARTFKFPTAAPVWATGEGDIISNATECSTFCHGNTATSMNATNRDNSLSHGDHLNKGYACNVCHVSTAASATALKSPGTSVRVSPNLKHVNGLPDIAFDTAYDLDTVLAGVQGLTFEPVGDGNSGYIAATGTCSVYCHSNGKGTYVAADWDLASSACTICHPNAAASLSAPHAKHMAITGVTCDDCHGTNATAGTHTGHLNKALTVTVNCNTCHGYDAGEQVPTWGQTMTNAYCIGCHTGTNKGVVKTKDAPDKGAATSRGHNRTTAYPVSLNPAANKDCTSCHLTAITNHVNGTTGDATGLNATAATCTTTCHGAGGSASNTKGIVTHMSKACTACHDPHSTTGSTNLYMVRSVSTGHYNGTVAFTALTGTDSFDEAGAAAGANNDDLCATCHSSAAGTSHNNREGTGLHADSQTHEDENCLTLCHKPHTEAAGAFIAGAGNSCNGCHDNPPATGAHREIRGDKYSNELHSQTGSHFTDETRDDCAYCHTGADLYTYDKDADQGAGRNHGNKTGRRAILGTTVGYQRDTGTNKWFCGTACHASSVADGFWYTWNGTDEGITAPNRTPVDETLNCNACHYYEATPAGANNTGGRAISTSHNRHFDKSKLCADCHGVPADTSHITTSGATDLAKIQGRAQATQNEAAVTRDSMVFDDPSNTCSGSGIALGCHATGAPVWGTAGPLGCTACHTDKTTSSVNPTSGLHSVVPVVSGVQHDESFPYNGGAGTGNCETCHTSSPSTGHQDGILDATRGAAGNTKIQFAASVNYVDGTAPTCAPGIAGCHFEQPTKTVDWLRKWHEGAADSTASCAGCHGDWVNGWNANVQHHTNLKAQTTHGSGTTWQCKDCHALEATTGQYPFTIGSNDWRQNAGENTTLHGNGVINVNDYGTGFLRVGGQSGCPDCHTEWQTDGKHAYTVTEWALAPVAGDAPEVTCATCHGGSTVGTSASNYWPDKANDFGGGGDASEDNIGRHQIHMEKLAQAVYNETIAQLLTDNGNGTAEVKQKELCSYCHDTPGADADHSNVMPAEVNSMFNLWNKGADNASYLAGNCSSVNCHNGKATSATAGFDWYGAGTQNCLLCHNDITVTTGGTTGATHAAHTGSAATYGKDIICGSCHGGNPSWSPYTVASTTAGNSHIDGQFKVGTAANASVSFTYGGIYTNAATRTVGDCATNLCHNDGKNGAPYKNGGANYNWQTAFTGCTACHRTDFNLGSSHNAHLVGTFATTFGKTLYCDDCHDAVTDSTSSMAGKTLHMDGAVTLAAGLTYSGTPATLTVGGTNTYGACTGSCHTNGKGGSPVTAATWNTVFTNCNICHGLPNTSGNDGARHDKHVANTAYVAASCGECHLSATTTTYNSANHFSGTVQTGNKISAHTAGTATCTNACHVVDASRGDWLDTAVLGCADCHVTGKIGAVALPASGLHSVTPRISAKRHDATVHASGCEVCHTTIRTQTSTHIQGSFIADGAANTDRGLFAAYSEAATGSCMGTGVNLAAGCHRDNGDWGRKWSTTVTANDGSECANCHGGIGAGYTAAAWVGGIAPDHTIDRDGDLNPEVMTDHSVCKSCHGFNGAADKDDNYLLTNVWNQGGPDTTMHGNSQITLNGGTNYNAANWGCDNAGCHLDAASGHALADSGWTVELGSFAAGGSCYGCHGNGSSQYWPDGGAYPDRAGAHAEHIPSIAAKMAGGDTLANRNATCDYCHPTGQHTGDQSAAPADVCNTDGNDDGTPETNTGYKFKRIVSPFATDNSGFFRAASTDKTCSNVACHASAPFTPGWYGDTVAPGNATLTAAAGPVPRSIKVSWTAPGDDGTLDGTAYKYDIRMGTTSAIATNFGLTTNYVQGVPTVKRRGEPQEAIVHNVNPSTTYYFALRTYDEAGNYGGTANAGGYTSYVVGATPDLQPPVLTGSPQWYGVDSAKALDASGTVKLSWTRAEDHSMPITYDIYYDTGSIDYGGDDNVLSTKDTSFRVTGLTDNQTYNFAVRAKDAFGNTDTNTATLQAIPQGLSEVPKTGQVYYANGAISGSNVTVNTTVYTATGSSTLTTGIYFIVNSGAAYAAKTNVYADTFAVYVSNANASNTMTAELGYYDTAFRSFTATNPAQTALTKSATLAARAKKVVPFKFGEMRWVPAGARLAVKLTQTQAGTVNWGSATNRGDLTTQLQPVNVSPTTPTVSTSVAGANVNIWWAASTDTADGVADTVHYDVYGDDGTGNFSYIIATGLTTNATSGSPLVWDTQAAGIALSGAVSNVQVRVEAGDSMNGKTFSHTASTSGNLSVNNSGDNVSPGTITNFKAETRPKQGSVYLTWTAPGDDGDNNGRAAAYDIRWATAVIDTDVKFGAATPLVSEPYPDFGGNGQGYEVLGLADGNYYFAIKAVDKGNKTSPLAYTTATSAAGPKCGICHSTPPDEDATKGNHAKHGFTIAECANCHGTEAATFTTDHQDGAIKLGWKTATPATATIAGQTVTYYQDPDGGGPLPALKIYEDTSGSGGFNPTGGDATDNGSCFNWSSQQVSGCHGPAAEASWDAAATLVCSACHGDNNRILDMWGHSFDDPGSDVKSAPPVDNHGYDGSGATPAERKYVGAHVAHLNYSFRLSKGDSCRLCHGASRPGVSTHADGIIDVKLDLNAAGATAQWSEGTPTTAGTCSSMSPDSCHPSTATPKWDSNETFACTNCHGMGGTTPSHVTDTAGGVSAPDNGTPTEQMPGNCTWCHVGGHPKEKKVTAITKASPAVVTTEHNHNLATNDKVTIHTQTGMTEINNKTYAVTVIDATRFSLQGSNTTTYGTFDYGTWIEGNGYGVILVPNDSRVGIAYQSGGVHLKANVGARGEMQSEAELCWSCHAPNNISEWGADSAPANATGYQSGNGNNYNFGQIYLNAAGGTVTSNWLGDGGGAFWRSGYTPGFNYKDGRIRSTHSTAPTGSSQLINGVPYNYGNTANSERLDPVNIIRCSNCHDVHNLNKAPEDNPNNLAALNGPPYLRGTWRSNPYKEDGAPQQGTSYTSQTGYLVVPRSSASTANAMGGYWIDQNSGNPTAGWSYETSAGLCQLCHGASVDALDYAPSGAENLWLSSNGHANSALGGSGAGAANIFKNGITSGVGRQGSGGGNVNPNPGVWMGFQISYVDSDDYGYGPRSGRVPYLTPTVSDPKISTLAFAWGVTVDATTTEIGYHQFSCSKCHNPHASRLPKLMITNCLDVARNTWDLSYDNENGTKWTNFQTTTSSWGTQKLSHLSTAQNCHRFVDVNGDNTPDESGWNKVTPW